MKPPSESKHSLLMDIFKKTKTIKQTKNNSIIQVMSTAVIRPFHKVYIMSSTMIRSQQSPEYLFIYFFIYQNFVEAIIDNYIIF